MLAPPLGQTAAADLLFTQQLPQCGINEFLIIIMWMWSTIIFSYTYEYIQSCSILICSKHVLEKKKRQSTCSTQILTSRPQVEKRFFNDFDQSDFLSGVISMYIWKFTNLSRNRICQFNSPQNIRKCSFSESKSRIELGSTRLLGSTLLHTRAHARTESCHHTVDAAAAA